MARMICRILIFIGMLDIHDFILKFNFCVIYLFSWKHKGNV